VENDEGFADGEAFGWAVVANVARETLHGPAGADTREGLRHFAAGAKVWVLPAQWGDGWQDALVVGLHRGPGRYVRMVVPLRHLDQFRVQAVYHPAVIRQLTRPQDGRQGSPRQWSSEVEAAETIRRHPETKDRLKRP
jgi:hypothetical protein